ncbi:MAG: PEGA domain-containing protein [Methanomicrobiales archaeon]|nr:PEGA domain-containing protein [Methanomicrobiales archaeon]
MATSWVRAGGAVAGILLIAGLLLLPASAEIPLITSWERTYGGGLTDTGESVRPTADGGYVVAGSTNSFGRGDFDVALYGIGPDGHLLWEQNLGTDADEFGTDVQVTPDGGFIVTGWSWSPSSSTDVYLVRTDGSGRKLWERRYGGSGSDYGNAVVTLPDGGYAIAGSTCSPGGLEDILLIRVGKDGELLWQTTIGGAAYDAGFDLLPVDNGNFVIAGSTDSFGSSREMFLVYAGSDGTPLWQQHYGGPGTQEGRSLARAADGGYVVAGGTDPALTGEWDACVIRTDSLGRFRWQQTWGRGGTEYGSAVAMTGDDGIVLAGRTTSLEPSMDIFLVRWTPLGTELWQRTFGGARYDTASGLNVTADGGLVIAGTTASFGSDDDVYLVRLAPPSGILAVTSSPSGAEIFLDGVPRGVTPATLEGVPAGPHTVLLQLEGYGESRVETVVESGSVPTVVDEMFQEVTPVPVETPTPAPTPSSLLERLFPAARNGGNGQAKAGILFPFRIPGLGHLLAAG